MFATKLEMDGAINLRNDPWVPGLERNLPRVQEWPVADTMTKVENLLNQDSVSWNVRFVDAFFNREEASAIFKLKLPSVTCEDRLCWIASKDGFFSVKSCFCVIQRVGLNQEVDGFWGII